MPKRHAVLLSLLALVACAKGAEIDSGFGGLGGSGPAAGPGPSGSGTGPTSGGPGSGSASDTVSTTTGPASGSGTGATDVSSSSTGLACSEMPCKLVEPQCGCEDTRQCSVGADGTRSCVAKGTVPIGSGCDMDACVPGAMCLVIPNVGHCFEFCSSDAQCTAPGGRCIVTLSDGMGGTVPNVTLCSENCNPLAAGSCPTPGTACQPALDENMIGFTICTDAGAGGDLDPCPTGYECGPGFGCFNVNNSPSCLQYCDVDAPACPGLTCFPLDPPLIVGSTNYGACN